MKSFQEYTDDDFDEDFYIDEGARGFSATVLFSRVLSISREVKRTRDTDKKLDLIASMGTHLAAMVVAMTQFTPKK